MPFTIPTFYVTFGGALSGQEQWQCGMHFAALPTSLPQVAAQAVADGAVAPLTTFWGTTGMANIKGSSPRLSYCRVYHRPANTETSDGVGAATLALTAAGTDRCPPQVSVVASFRSNDPSRRGRGRMYLPAVGPVVVSDRGQLDAATPAALATAVRNLGVAIAALTDVDYWAAGTSGAAVTTVVVDSILDTQRRRRNALTPITVGISSVFGP